MEKHIVFMVSTMILITSKINKSSAFIETITTVIKTSYDVNEVLMNWLEKSNKVDDVDRTLHDVREMNKDMKEQFISLVDKLDSLSLNFDIKLVKNDLENNLSELGYHFVEILRARLNHLSGKKFHREYYENLRDDHESKAGVSMHHIRNMIIRLSQTIFSPANYINNTQVLKTLCATGMSNVQYLDVMLGKLKIATAQYYFITVTIYTFLNIHATDEHKKNYDAILKDQLKGIRFDFKETATEIKNLMRRLSREIWRCESRTGTARYQNSENAPHHELTAFTKYLVVEDIFSTTQCSKVCKNKTLKESCYGGSYDFCYFVRSCPHDLVGCNVDFPFKVYNHSSQIRNVCLNKDKNAVNRYTSIVKKEESDNKFFCKDGTAKSVKPIGGISYMIRVPTCDVCDCICQENFYRVTLGRLVPTAINKVITGARLMVVDNTIQLSIRQATLYPLGEVKDERGKPWVSDHFVERKEPVLITWNDIRSIDLSDIQVPENCAITELGFELRNKRIRLSVRARKIDFLYGKVGYYCDVESESSEDNSAEFDLTNQDVPSRTTLPSYPLSQQDQFVRFTTTSPEKDGGQTTIPFVDTQPIESYPAGPISGVGLMLRGVPGYGGYLTLKLYTFDATSYVQEDLGVSNDDDARFSEGIL